MAKIMLVEDDNNLREIYEARLLAEGYEIVSAADGEEALAVAVKEKPDLIISDVMMPKISGFDMLDILRTTPETKDVKVIMMTALSQAEDKGRADKLGADRYLVKSQVTLEDVAKVAREVLGGEAPAATADPSAAPAAPATPAPAAPTAVPVTDAPAASTPAEPTAVPADPTPAPTTDAPAATSIPISTPADDATAVPVTDTPTAPALDTSTETPSAEPATEGTSHGKTLEPIESEEPAAEEETPPAEPTAVPAEPAAETPAETPADEPADPAPAQQPGAVIQPGQDPTQIAL